jgi:hypothetical protein
MFYPEKEEGETALGLDGEANNATDCDLEKYFRASGIFATCESESNASKTVLEKLMRTSQSYTAG